MRNKIRRAIIDTCEAYHIIASSYEKEKNELLEETIELIVHYAVDFNEKKAKKEDVKDDDR